ncbi:MAG: 3'(2'),5'-bisphosphate nucleotidase CysQ [Chitinophagales bacterium]
MLESIDIQILIDISEAAGDAIMEIYKNDFSVEMKADKSPLTSADKASNDVIVAGLQKHFPNIPIISEETRLLPYSERKNWEYCWVVDPLDGTKEFIKKNGEFTTNIALIHKGHSVLGVVYIPVSKEMYYAKKGSGSFKVEGETHTQIHTKAIAPNETVKVFVSRSHLNEDTQKFVDELKEKHDEVDLVSAGSSLKFTLIAEGKAHFYPRFAPTMEWDTAAGHIIAEEAGATITKQPEGDALRYNRENLLNPYFLVMC